VAIFDPKVEGSIPSGGMGRAVAVGAAKRWRERRC